LKGGRGGSSSCESSGCWSVCWSEVGGGGKSGSGFGSCCEGG
jgi:hypothetical protein